jgi:hypothetical protein
MRKLLILFLLLSYQTFGQSDGYYEIPKRFYSRIDSLKKLDCCDTGKAAISLSYEIPLFQYPIFDKLDIEEYEQKVMDEGYVEILVQELVDAYYNIKPKLRNKITRSCFTLKENYKIEYEKTGSGIYWVEGTLKVTLNFQSEDKYFCQPWYKRLYYRVKR